MRHQTADTHLNFSKVSLLLAKANLADLSVDQQTDD